MIRGKMAYKTQVRLDAVVQCKPQRLELPVEKCLDAYVEANAFGNKDSCCFRCPHGQRIRNMIARS